MAERGSSEPKEAGHIFLNGPAHPALDAPQGRQSPWGLLAWRDSFGGDAIGSALPRLWWLNLSLVVITFFTTTAFGFSLTQSFAAGHPLDADTLFDAYSRLGRLDPAVWRGVTFSVPLLMILLAHEFGHYLTSVRWGVNASLPYFLPSPLLLGTFGAFIRIRSPIYTRKSLFDIGIAGPIAGFVVLLPFLIAGTLQSRVVPATSPPGSVTFGVPFALQIFETWKFPHVGPLDIALHPMAMAGWVGLLATAINLMPMGQLDGGHILYALFGARGHRWVSTGMVAVLALLGFEYHAWWLWAVVMFVLGRRHPLIYDDTPVSKTRVVLSGLALIIFLLSFSVVPVRVH